MKWSNLATIGCTAAAIGLLAFATPAQAGKPWHSVAADTQTNGECSTNVVGTTNPAVPGGASCYSTMQFVPGSANVLRISWSSQGDAHNGAALQITCIVTPASTGTPAFCFNGVGADGGPATWMTKVKLPTNLDAGGTHVLNNCFDGAGLSGDCHDNTVEHTWCVDIVGDDVFNVDFRVATTSAGKTAFTEKSSFFIDSSKLADGCDANGQVD